MNREFIVITSKDEFEFVLTRQVANLCPFFRDQIKFSDNNIAIDFIQGDILEIVIQYLHFKNRWMTSPI
jgi:hypothetical protein